jgi:hypothetical protein
MSTRRRNTPHPNDMGMHYTLLDELRASPTEPMPEATRRARMADIRKHFHELAYGLAPTRREWKVIAVVGNMFETMLRFKMVEDPHGILAAAQSVLIQVAEHALDNSVPVRLVGTEVAIIETLIDAYGDVLEALPHRDIIKVARETNIQMRKPGYDANPAKRKK